MLRKIIGDKIGTIKEPTNEIILNLNCFIQICIVGCAIQTYAPDGSFTIRIEEPTEENLEMECTEFGELQETYFIRHKNLNLVLNFIKLLQDNLK